MIDKFRRSAPFRRFKVSDAICARHFSLRVLTPFRLTVRVCPAGFLFWTLEVTLKILFNCFGVRLHVNHANNCQSLSLQIPAKNTGPNILLELKLICPVLLDHFANDVHVLGHSQIA